MLCRRLRYHSGCAAMLLVGICAPGGSTVVCLMQAVSKRASGQLAPGTGAGERPTLLPSRRPGHGLTSMLFGPAGRPPTNGVQAPSAPPQRQAHLPAPTAAQRHALSPAPPPRNSQTPPPAKGPAGDRPRPPSTTPQPQSGEGIHARRQGEQQRALQQQQALKLRAKAGRGSAASHGLPPEAMRLLQAAAREHGLRPVLTMLLLMAPNGCSKQVGAVACLKAKHWLRHACARAHIADRLYGGTQWLLKHAAGSCLEAMTCTDLLCVSNGESQ